MQERPPEAPLSAGDVAAAVRDLLSAARLPLDLDRQTLMQETLRLRDQLKAAQSAADSADAVGGARCCRLSCTALEQRSGCKGRMALSVQAVDTGSQVPQMQPLSMLWGRSCRADRSYKVQWSMSATPPARLPLAAQTMQR